MNLFKTIKKLSTVFLLLSFFSFTAMPITNLIGISPPSQLSDLTEFTRLAIVFIFATIAVTIMIIFGVGYFTLTGWHNYKSMSKLLRLFLAFILGYVAFTASGPIAMLIPVPLLPTIIVAILLWAVLRSISSFLSEKSPSQKDGTVEIEKAIATAKSFLKKLDPSTKEFIIQEVKMVDGAWEALLLSKQSGQKYKVKIDGSSGGVVVWERV
jgi:hypothetical protein